MKKIGFYCEHAFGLYSIVPLYKKYVNNNYEVYIISYKKYEEIVIREFHIPKDKIVFIEDYQSRLGSKISQWFQILGVNLNFSEFYSQRVKIKLGSFNYKISKIFNSFKIENKRVNLRYHQLIILLNTTGILKKIPLDFDKLFVVSKVFNPYLIAPFAKNVFLIMESWDHPGKEPFFINPKIAFGWNRPLAQELKTFQNFQNVRRMGALKFRYISELEKLNEDVLFNKLGVKYKEDLQKIDSANTVVYPICTSSNYFAFEGEVEFVKVNCQSVMKVFLNMDSL